MKYAQKNLEIDDHFSENNKYRMPWIDGFGGYNVLISRSRRQRRWRKNTLRKTPIPNVWKQNMPEIILGTNSNTFVVVRLKERLWC